MAKSVEFHPQARPALGREGVGVVSVSTWDVGTPERQRATLRAIEETWRKHGWPDHAALLSYSVHIGDDGRTLLHYGQWRDQAAYEDFFAHYRDARNGEIDAAVPGIERLELNFYRLYRGQGDQDRVPGSVVIVEAEFDGPDQDRVRRWIDGVHTALDSDTGADVGGGIGGWFHVSTDGTRMVNYAEWESAEAHQKALDASGEGVGSDTEEWAAVRAFPGVVTSRVRRYTPGVSITPGA
ncbi:antibiotic biosynthesis monooxygenase [Streptomyces sp. NPDC057638]|uniref:antibiotic biosynthesis monooxygenase n=1 Tax=Streptomyces sp. NPDC057638 TaxID=3346190 RepID=UPI0036B4613A